MPEPMISAPEVTFTRSVSFEYTLTAKGRYFFSVTVILYVAQGQGLKEFPLASKVVARVNLHLD